MKKNLIAGVLLLLLSITFAQDKCEPVGWATQNGGVTGGGNATPVVVDSYSEFKDAVTDEDVKVVHVSGTITFPSNGRISFQDQSGKTIFGLPGSKLVSTDQSSSGSGIFNAKRLDNVIFQNLVFEGPGAYDTDGNDNMTIDDSRNIWVDHCEFRDGTDGNLDIKNKSDFISVTWTTFKYLKAPVAGGSGGSDDHRYSNLFGSSKSATGDRGKLRITMQYCHWGEGVVERMPRVRYGKIHMVNNLFDSDESKYCVRMGYEADVRLEGNVFENQPKPVDKFDNEYTALYASNNTGYSNTSEGSGFTPPYSLDIANPSSIKNPILSCAGATLSGWNQCSTCSGEEVKDCNGVDGGSAYLDDCDICVGGNTGKTACTLDCNGDINGSATLDACGVCTGGNTGVQACSGVLEGEDNCAGEGVLEATNSGYQGEGYFNFDNVNGSSATYYLVSSGNQTVTLGFRYANGGSSARPLTVSVNGNNQGTISGDITGGWTSWSSEAKSINLIDGVNTIILTATSNDGGPNFDLISLPALVSAGGCTADCNGVIGGSAFLDNCNTCVGGNTGKEACEQDCNGDWGGTAVLDNCDQCVEGNTNATACTQDCAGNWGGTEEYDDCGVCGGTNACTDCNGDINGSAYFDDCGVCVAGNTNKDACTGVMQAEIPCSIDGIELEDKNEGFFGDGYVNTDNELGVSVSWVLSSTQAQTVSISFRYANGGTTSRDGEIFVNGQSAGALLLPSTGAWTTWNETSVDLSLNQGFNEVSVTSTSSEGLANIDALFLADGVEDANCSPVLELTQTQNIELSISPNPTSDVLHISQSVTWVLENTMGEILDQGISSVVNVANLQEGLYLLKVGTTTFKFVKD